MPLKKSMIRPGDNEMKITEQDIKDAIVRLERYLEVQCAGFKDMTQEEVINNISLKSQSLYTAWMILTRGVNDE